MRTLLGLAVAAVVAVPLGRVVLSSSSEGASASRIATARAAAPARAAVAPPALRLEAGSSKPRRTTPRPLVSVVPRRTPVSLATLRRLAPRTVGSVRRTHDLGDGGPARAFGLAYRDDVTPHRLLVADYREHRIHSYERVAGRLVELPAETIHTDALAAGFVNPRGLAYAAPYLYAVTSNDPDEDGTFSTRLWRIHLDDPRRPVSTIDLSSGRCGLRGRRAFGLGADGTYLYLAYDTTGMGELAELQRGILRLRIAAPALPRSSVARSLAAKIQRLTSLSGTNGFRVHLAGHLPGNGRKVSGDYARAPCLGLAVMPTARGGRVLWGTSWSKYLYAACAQTGRGMFRLDSPGWKKIHGLAWGGGSLWAVDRDKRKLRIHQVEAAYGSGRATQSEVRAVRRVTTYLTSTARRAADGAGVAHNHGKAFDRTNGRPSQGRDRRSLTVERSPGATLRHLFYDVAHDPRARQRYLRVVFSGARAKDDTLWSRVTTDVWLTSHRSYVYPSACTTARLPSSEYLRDDRRVYDLADRAAYDAFWSEVTRATRAEYGVHAARTRNPFWLARMALELIVERHDYGNVSDPASGMASYGPANLKLRLLFDGEPGNEKLSCSSSTFALVGLLRYRGIAARWVGTTKLRRTPKIGAEPASGKTGADGDEADAGEEVTWDADGDGFLGSDEAALDTSFHRWAEVWCGPVYGWQRFDATPFETRGQVSQWDLMAKTAAGVGVKDLVLTTGSGYEEPFWEQSSDMQRYNAVTSYDRPGDWKTSVARKIVWRNACFVSVGATLRVGSKARVRWTASGRWDLDRRATVSVSLRPVGEGDAIPVLENVSPAQGGAVIDLSAVPYGRYRVAVNKDGDAITGGQGGTFDWYPALEALARR